MSILIRDDILYKFKTSINLNMQVNISKLVRPFGINYFDTEQNTKELESIRKNKITASRPAYVPRLYGKKMFN